MRHFVIRLCAIAIILAGSAYLTSTPATASQPCCYNHCMTHCLNEGYSFSYCHGLCNEDCEACEQD